jgi:RNA polymerase sigma-70 factor (ECF subfamily)
MRERDGDSAAGLPALTVRPLTPAGDTGSYARSTMGTTAHGSLSAQRTSEEWLEALRSHGARRDRAIADLHALLLRSARFEVGRRRAALSHLHGEELDDVAMQAADDALVAVLAKLDHYRGASRFTTWAYKFALLEAGVRLRRRAWQGREVVLEPEAWPSFSDARASAQDVLEQGELLAALKTAISEGLTSHQRDVFVALALNQVPIDVLAERLNTTRGALYKTLHDARRKLRQELMGAGFDDGNSGATAPRED